MVTLTKPNSTETQTQAHEIDEGLLGLDDAEEAAISVDELLEELFSIPMAPQRESLPSRIVHRISGMYDWLSGPAFTEQDILNAELARIENSRRSATLIV